ncbi:MAG: HIT domain-containing protein [Candidatus Dormibacteraceae bacterium]
MEECVFCRIAAGEIPATVVANEIRVMAFEDSNPQAPLHVLVIPRRHLTDVHAIRDGQLLLEMYDLARQVAAQRGVEESGYRLIFNLGPDGGQTVLHAHLHVLGGRQLSWPPG